MTRTERLRELRNIGELAADYQIDPGARVVERQTDELVTWIEALLDVAEAARYAFGWSIDVVDGQCRLSWQEYANLFGPLHAALARLDEVTVR